MASDRADLRTLPLYEVPPPVHYEFCRVMDVLSDRDWTQFASEVLRDITAVQLAEKKERRTDSLMLQWQNRNGSVGQLLDLLQKLELLRPWDIINNWVSSLPPRVVPPPPSMPFSGFNPPHWAASTEPPATLPTCPLRQSEIAVLLPKPQPPELGSPLQSALSSGDSLPQPLSDSPAAAALFSLGACKSLVMAWSYEEVHDATCGFTAHKIGEGGFGEVYRANLSNIDCAVKRFKKDCSLNWSLLRDSFQTEVEKLSKFRHPNIVDLLGYSDGGGTYCLIYSFMENRSLDDQLRSDGSGLSWSQRVSIAKGAATALQYLHNPPEGQMPLVHGDVKSANILLDRYMEVKLADFGLAQFTSRGPSDRTRTLGKTQEVRGTLAYLPEDYMRGRSKLNAKVDVYGFGVVLLEILTGRRALEKDKKTGQDYYLKDLVKDVLDSEAEWRKQLDKRLLLHGGAEPTGFMEVVSLTQSCCLDYWKKRPFMTEVYKTLQKLHDSLNFASSSPSPATTPSLPGPPRSLDSSLSALSLSAPSHPSEHTYYPKANSLSPPQTLHSSTVTPTHLPHATALPPSRSSFDGPCETDESRGHSQFDIKSNGLGPRRSNWEQASVPTEDEFNFAADSKDTGLNRNQASGHPECSSPAESLQSQSPVVLNPSKLHLLENIARYNQGCIQTLELLSIKDHYLRGHPEEASRGPEESDEMDFNQP